MKYCLITILFLTFYKTNPIYGQVEPNPPADKELRNYGMVLWGSNIIWTGIPVDPMDGETYNHNDYKVYKIILDNGEVVDNAIAKFHILSNNLAVRFQGKEQAASGEKILQFSYFDNLGEECVFENVKLYPPNPLALSGFYEILDKSDDYSILVHHYIKVIEPTYNVALDAGSRAPRAYKKRIYFVLKDKRYTSIVSLKNKELKNKFSDNYKEIKKYIKSNDVDFNDKEKMTGLIKHCLQYF